MSDDDTVIPAASSAEPTSDAGESSGFSRRSFLKAAALGTAAAALLNRGGLELGPASALAGQTGCSDLSGNPCTANDVNLIGDVIVLNPCSCSSGSFTAQIQAQVKNNTGTGRYCIQLNLPPGALGSQQTAVECIVLSNTAGGGSTAPANQTSTMTGNVPNFPCNAGVVTVSNATVGWSTSSNAAGCDPNNPTSVPGGQCHRQTIQFVNFQATLSCGNGTQNCTAPCTGLATLTACVIADSSELPVSLTLTNNAGLATQTASITSVDANFSGCHTFTATLTQNTTFSLSATDSKGCTRSGITKSIAFSPLTQPGLVVTTPTCAGGSTVFTASPSGLSDYTFQVDGTNHDNGTNPVLTLSGLTFSTAGHTANVTVANALACTAISPNKGFNIPTLVQIPTFTASTASCAGNNVTLTATATGGSGSYTFTFKEGTSTLASLSTDANPNSTGTYVVVAPSSGPHTYTVSVSDSSGCGTSASTSTSVPSAVAVNSFTASTPSCAGNTVTLTATGTGGTPPYTYAFSEGTAALGTNTSGSLTITPTSGPHTYTVSVTDSNQCDNASRNASTTVPTPVTTSLDLGSNTNCAGNVTFTASGSGGSGTYTFAWTVDTSPVANHTGNTLTYTPTVSSLGLPHTITATATDSLGCTSTNTATRTVTECVSFTIT